MGSQDEDYASIIRSAIQDVGDEEDGPPLNVMSNEGVPGGSATGGESTEGELKYVILLKAAVAMVQTGEITMEQYVEGVSKLDGIAANALKLYQIPAVKNDLPNKLSEHQNALVMGLEEQLHILREGLATLLAYAESGAVGDLEVGLETAVGAYHAMDEIQTATEREHAAVMQKEKEEKAARAARAAAAVSEEGDS